MTRHMTHHLTVLTLDDISLDALHDDSIQ